MTSQKTEKKRISSKIFVALAALTLVSCCFLGTTFARYTTGTTSGSAGADIADWEIVITDGSTGGTGTGEYYVIQPDGVGRENGDTITSGSERENEISGSGAVLTITNQGQVNAEVKVTITKQADESYWVKDYKMNGAEVVIENGKYVWSEAPLVEGRTYHDQQGRAYTWDATNKQPLYTTNGVAAAPEEWGTYGLDDILEVGALTIKDGTSGTPIILGTGDSVTLQIGPSTWTTDFENETAITDGGYPSNTFPGDLRDTWIGENLLKVGYTFTWEAVQTDEDPTV